MSDIVKQGSYLLLVEDNPDDVDLTLLTFKQHKLAHEVVVVGDGAAALDFMFGQGAYAGRDVANVPQVILLDINLPKLSGLDVLKALREDERTKLVPIVMLTTSSEDHDVIESYDNGANSYVQKPIDFDEFVKALSSLGAYWLSLNRVPGAKEAR